MKMKLCLCVWFAAPHDTTPPLIRIDRSHRWTLTPRTGRGDDSSYSGARPRGNRQTKTSFTDPTAVSEWRLHTNHCLTDPPAQGSAIQFGPWLKNSVARFCNRTPHQCRATRSLSKRQGSEPRAHSFLAVVAHTQNAGAIPCAVGATSPASRHFGAKPSGPRGVLGWTP